MLERVVYVVVKARTRAAPGPSTTADAGHGVRSLVDGLSADERQVLVQVARRHFLDDLSKVEIAREIGLSRFKVARLLEQARDLGIVTITLDDAGVLDDDLSARVHHHLGLEECIIVGSTGDDHQRRRQVGGAAARLLTATLRAGDVLGLAWGRTLTAMTKELTALPAVTVVQLTGVVKSDLAESPVEIVRTASLCGGGMARPLFAPLLVDDVATAAALRRQADVAEVMALAEHVTVAMVAVGSWDPPISQLREVMSEPDRQRLEARGVQAEVAGILIDQAGVFVGADIAERCISITAEQLARVPRVIAVAAGASKAHAVLAVVRSGLITSLVADRQMAEALLEMPPNSPMSRPGSSP